MKGYGPRWRRRLLFGLGLGLAAIASCYGTETTPFPPGLEPPGDNRAEPPAAQNGDPYPEVLSVVTGEEKGYNYFNAKGYVHASVAATWEALRDPEICVDQRNVNSWTVELDVEPDYEVSFRLHDVVEDIITVEFEVTWRQGRVEGSADKPKVVSAVYQKTWGSTVIDYMAGSVVLREVDDSTTQIELVEQLTAAMRGAESVDSFNRDLYARILARVHGEPPPTY